MHQRRASPRQIEVRINQDQLDEIRGLYGQADELKEIKDKLEVEIGEISRQMVKVAYPDYGGVGFGRFIPSRRAPKRP